MIQLSNPRIRTRRQLLQSASCGFGYLALAGLTTRSAQADTIVSAGFEHPLASKTPQLPARAKRVIFLFMQGGPSHVDTFDYKPELPKLAERGVDKLYSGKRINGKLLPSPWKFSPHGESGMPISELYPHLAQHSDELCLINGMHTDNPAHPQATIMLHTGSINFVRPSVGAWVVYGLGTENQDLPGFVTINPANNLGGAQNYGSSFLPASYQATRLDTGPNPLANVTNPRMTREEQRRHLNLVQSMNQDLLDRSVHDTELEGIIESYELAFRMQSTVPELMDIASEPEATKQMYGIGEKATDNFGKQCLMARRLAEAGVRFIEVTHRGWDQHNNLRQRLAANCLATDKPIAALIADLKRRNMLDDTLIVWSGEFGRTPAEQNNGNGRRHNASGFTTWLAGGGVKGGLRYGETDPTGFDAVRDKVHTHDLHATMLYLLGLDHERLTYRYSGRDFRLTDVYGNVVQDIIS